MTTEVEALARVFEANHAAIVAMFGETEKSVKSMAATMADLEQRMARRHLTAGGGGDPPVTLGAQLVNHADYESKIAPLANQRGKITLELKNTITSTVGGVGLVAPDHRADAVILPKRRLFVRDLVSPGATVSNAINYPKQTVRTNNAAVVSEGQRKPESNILFDMQIAPVRTIAHWTKASRQMIDDAPQLQSMVDGELRYGLSLVEENEMLFGDGTGQHIFGIIPQATAYETSRNVALDNRFDTLAHAIAQAEVALLPATGIVMNASDLEGLKTVKDTTGRYIANGGPMGLAIQQIWGRPVVGTIAMPAGTFLTGAFFDGAQIFDRQNVSVLVSTENEDDFLKNLVTVLCEERVAMTVRRPGAFITGTFPSA
jgi:HK97 family phage major capsid protein